MKPLRKKNVRVQGKRSRADLASSSTDLDLRLDDVVVVFACNEHFVPYMSVAIQSILENVTTSRHYDIIVLTRDITPTSMITLTHQCSHLDNVGIGFLDVDQALGDIQLPHHGHFRPETYFRLLSPTLLPNVNKAIYLDSDLVVCHDLSELFDTNIDDYLVGATRDADTIGQLMGYDETVKPYLQNELGLAEPMSYFQAGVLLMNLKALRNNFSAQEILKVCTERRWRWLDQDVLNRLCSGKYKVIPMNWNYLVDWQGLRRTHIVAQAPIEIQAAYDRARRNPYVIHYAGPDNRPWLYPNSDMAGIFWNYALKSPYIDELELRLAQSRNTVSGIHTRVKAALIFRAFFPAFDTVCAPGTKRRQRVISVYNKLGGTNF